MPPPATADIRAGIAYLLRNNADVQAWATNHDISLDGGRFKEWQPFADVMDLGVLIAIDPVIELVPESSCDGPYEARFTIYVGYTGAGSSQASLWLAVLERALIVSWAVWAPAMEGQAVTVRDVKFISRLGQTRGAENWLLPSQFRCLVEYIN